MFTLRDMIREWVWETFFPDVRGKHEGTALEGYYNHRVEQETDFWLNNPDQDMRFPIDVVGSTLLEILQEIGFCSSNSDARRMAKQNAIKFDAQVETDLDKSIPEGVWLVSLGKKKQRFIRKR